MDAEVNGKYTKSAEAVASPRLNEPFNEELFRQVYQYEPIARETWSSRLRKEAICSTKTLYNIFPILKWLPMYKRNDIVNDLMAGLTIAVMNIPQVGTRQCHRPVTNFTRTNSGQKSRLLIQS